MARRERWRAELHGVRQMHGWVVEAEAIVSGSWAAAEEAVTNVKVAARFDAWVAKLTGEASPQQLTEPEQRCLSHVLQVTARLRPQLIQCYDVVGLPRTNTDREGFIRAITTRYRRVSGRKHWKRYVLRYGRRGASYEAHVRRAGGAAGVNGAVERVTPVQGRRGRAAQRATGGPTQTVPFPPHACAVPAGPGGALDDCGCVNVPIAWTVFF
ncbi:MAG: hypothetical protein M3380_11415 [Chloroflexota bacterium]|nr:hypothetical protein [Chloroflexota bacterium]